MNRIYKFLCSVIVIGLALELTAGNAFHDHTLDPDYVGYDTFSEFKPVEFDDVNYPNREELFNDIRLILQSENSSQEDVYHSLFIFFHNELVYQRHDLELLQNNKPLVTPFYLNERKNDLPELVDLQFKHEKLYQYLIAAGMNLNSKEYILLKNIELEAELLSEDLLLSEKQQAERIRMPLSKYEEKELKNSLLNQMMELDIQNKCIQAIKNNDYSLVLSLVDIDNCLRCQQSIGYRSIGTVAPLKITEFEQENGKTGLHLAVQYNHHDLVRFFLQSGKFNLSRLTRQRHTPLDLAMLYRKTQKDLMVLDQLIDSSDRTVVDDFSDEEVSDELKENQKIIRLLLDAGAQLTSLHKDIQSMMDTYKAAMSRFMIKKTKPMTASTRKSMYASIANMFKQSPKSSPRVGVNS